MKEMYAALWKMTFDGRRPLMEDDLWWKTTFEGTRPLMEDDLWWKTPFDGRRSSMEDDNEDNLKNKEDLHIAGRHTALDIFRFAVFFSYFSFILYPISQATAWLRQKFLIGVLQLHNAKLSPRSCSSGVDLVSSQLIQLPIQPPGKVFFRAAAKLISIVEQSKQPLHLLTTIKLVWAWHSSAPDFWWHYYQQCLSLFK